MIITGGEEVFIALFDVVMSGFRCKHVSIAITPGKIHIKEAKTAPLE